MNNRLNRISQHLKNPQNTGQIKDADAASQAGSASCRNLVKFSAQIKKNTIEDIRFKAFGCDWTIASASYITALARGKGLWDAAKISIEDIQLYFGAIPRQKIQAAASVIDAFSGLISSYVSKNTKNLYPLDSNRVAVAMSGGIDSSVSAKILKDKGYDIFGLTMKILPDAHDFEGQDKTCCSPTDIRLAREVCSHLGIPHFVIDLVSQFKQTLIDGFLNEYLQGRTPNPCVDCNKYIKFGQLLGKAFMLGAAHMASGHYCILEKASGDSLAIRKAVDRTKDQSYMLWRLSQDQLEHIKFPLGKFHKQKIKDMGKRYFPFLGEKPESQDICFIGEKGYHQLLSGYSIGEGKIVNGQGKILGTHKGYPYYTIGQRKGLGISHNRPLYVKKIIPSENIIVVGEKQELLQKEFKIGDINFISGKPPAASFNAQVMIRYKFDPAPAVIRMSGKKTAICIFDRPQPAITPGQSAVFYQNDLLLGGGIIVK
ncbi:MAG: tRNA 2-thiouridine(34) synthase MnmA [Actinomycetota bacterium]